MKPLVCHIVNRIGNMRSLFTSHRPTRKSHSLTTISRPTNVTFQLNAHFSQQTTNLTFQTKPISKNKIVLRHVFFLRWHFQFVFFGCSIIFHQRLTFATLNAVKTNHFLHPPKRQTTPCHPNQNRGLDGMAWYAQNQNYLETMKLKPFKPFFKIKKYFKTQRTVLKQVSKCSSEHASSQ